MSAVCFALIATGPVQFATIYRPTCRQSAAVVHAFDCMQRIALVPVQHAVGPNELRTLA